MTVFDSSISTHVCPKCNEEKPLTLDFWVTYQLIDKSKRFGKQTCRACINIARREYAREYAKQRRSTELGRLAQNAAMRKWKAANTEKRQEYRRREAEKKGKSYMPGIPAYIAAYIVKYGVAPNTDNQYKSVDRAYDKVIGRNARDAFRWWFAKKSDTEVAAWYAATGKPWENPRLDSAEKFRIRYRLDPEYHAWHIIRCTMNKQKGGHGDIGTVIRNSLVGRGGGRKAERLLGYSMSELRIHLERQFTKGMTWEIFLHGKIHIDHILPKSSFDLEDPDQWRVCWSLPNLRPMWEKDNRAKSAKVLTLL